MNGVPISFDGVWKGYPAWPSGPRTLRAIASRRAPLLLRRGQRRWALEDVTFQVAPGHAVGVIGRNGAGKSTLLRLAAGLGRPTRGRIHVHDETAAVLSLGDTLDPALTGSENAMTAAIVAGWSRAEARRLLPRIVEFAELEEVADAPLRTYSDGMKVRLAFGVVAQLEPRVLLVDEVLAVGDLRFQAKCIARIRELQQEGATVLLASHDLGLVRRQCAQAAWLDGGHLVSYGDAGAVADAYEEAARDRTRAETPAAVAAPGPLRLGDNRVGTQQATIERVTLGGLDGSDQLAAGAPLSVVLELTSRAEAITDPIVSLAVRRADDDSLCFETDTRTSGIALGRLSGKAVVEVVFDRLDLAPGEHVVDVGLYRSDWDVVYDYHWHAHRFHVEGGGGGKGAFRPPHRWVLRDDPPR
ncbi:MAG: ABC transporter ATP-binding protein [Thermoleophilaceae bacterium]